MGLLTGFSLISGVEMVFFAAKICMGFVRMLKEKKNQKKIVSHQTVIMVKSEEKEEEDEIVLEGI